MQSCSNIQHVSGPAEEEKERDRMQDAELCNIQHVSGPAEEEKERAVCRMQSCTPALTRCREGTPLSCWPLTCPS